MFFKKLFLSLGALGVVGGAGLGIYYSLKEDNVEELVPPSSARDLWGSEAISEVSSDLNSLPKTQTSSEPFARKRTHQKRRRAIELEIKTPLL